MPEIQQDETILVALHPNNLEEVESTRKELEVDAEVLKLTTPTKSLLLKVLEIVVEAMFV